MQCRSSRTAYRQGDFFGTNTENMSPLARVVLAVSVLAPVALGAAIILTMFGEVFWLVFTFGWMIFPAFGLRPPGEWDVGPGFEPFTEAVGARLHRD
ncbi:hypothetical protein BH23ACT11_BH23ACT11_19670 [soil metagenome]